ncbi:MAG: IPT/TIG domain-containing protein [Acidobacteria bacterium]|nr:IPT/TIG domain-containing protein [Acidobacteriota bacterium]
MLRHIGKLSLCLATMAFVLVAPVRGQVSVTAAPPAVISEFSAPVNITAQVQGTLPGESTAVTWSLNDQPFTGNAPTITLSPALLPASGTAITKAASIHDDSKFAALPVVSLKRSDVAAIPFPLTMAYHPTTGFVYVASPIATNAGKFNTAILQIAPDGAQTTVTTLQSEVIYNLTPYSQNGTAYLLGVGLAEGWVYAIDLGSKRFRRVVGKDNDRDRLLSPVSLAIHPMTGDLYIAEQNARDATPPRSISVVSRSDLETAISGTFDAPFRGLSFVVPQISGVGFVSNPVTHRISLLATSGTGQLYQINPADGSGTVVASGLGQAQQILTIQSSQLGYSFVLTSGGSSGTVSGMVARGSGTPLTLPFSVAGGLNTVTDLILVPAGTRYSSSGQWLILACNSSPNASEGKVVRWEPDASTPNDFYSYNDRVQASVRLISPSAGDVLTPGAPFELRWTINDSNALNPSTASFPAPVQISISTDGGANYVPASGSTYIPSGPQANQYSQTWQVPASLAGQNIRLALQIDGLDGSLIKGTSSTDVRVLDKSAGVASAMSLSPNFGVNGQSAAVTINGLNLQPSTSISLGDNVSVNSLKQVSNSRLEAQVQAAALAAIGPRTVFVCGAGDCQQLQNGFYVLPSSGPRITTVEPQTGSSGATVKINGNNFSGLATNNAVRFGDIAATVSRATPTQLIVQVPFGINRGELPITVQVDGVSSNSAQFFLVPASFKSPVINADGVVNGASFSPGVSPVAPGSIISLFGINVVPTIASADSVPLPTELLNTTVMIGGVPAPLFYAAPTFSPGGQINAQTPEEVLGLNTVAVTLVSNGITGSTVLLSVAAQSPGVFSTASDGKGAGAVLNQDGTLNSISNPEHIGSTLQIYATGLGGSDVPTGSAALSSPLSLLPPPVVTIDGVSAPVTFTGRAPGFVGLDQINVTIPAGVSTGRPVALVLTASGNTSNTVTVNVAP